MLFFVIEIPYPPLEPRASTGGISRDGLAELVQFTHTDHGRGPTRSTSSACRALEKAGFPNVARLPYSLKILLENLLRREDARFVDPEDIQALAGWDVCSGSQKEIAFTPARVLLQDFTGVPAVVDLAAMRDGIVKLGGDPRKVNPLQPVELVIDHSVQVDHYVERNAADLNAALEFGRNRERYTFLRWGQEAFDNFRVVPPDTGIVHQVNLEYLARVIFSEQVDGRVLAYPDTLVGTDSHTTMVNGLGVVGWGVGGIEAEAAMLGQPISMLIPEVVGFRLVERLPEGATATDLVLTITERLRKLGVVGKFVEFYGPGLEFLTIADRATLGNMSPEYGATIAICPIDEMTLDYLRLTGRDAAQRQAGRGVRQRAGPVPHGRRSDPAYTTTIELDLSTVEPSLAGPKRPQDRVSLRQAKFKFEQALETMLSERKSKTTTTKPADKPGESSAPAVAPSPAAVATALEIPPGLEGLDHGAVVIAAITSCTNTSNPSVMIGAGLLARNAVQRGLTVKPWVKTSLAPGLADRHRVLQGRGPPRVSRRARLQHRRLRLHDVHRQQRSAAGRGLEDREGQEPRRRLGAERQPELRGTDPVAGPRQLPGVAAAGRRVCAGRPDAGGSDDRAAGYGSPGSAGLPQGHLADRARDPGDDAQLGEVGDVPEQVRAGVRRRRSLAFAADSDRRALRVDRRFDLHPQSRRSSRV